MVPTSRISVHERGAIIFISYNMLSYRMEFKSHSLTFQHYWNNYIIIQFFLGPRHVYMSFKKNWIVRSFGSQNCLYTSRVAGYGTALLSSGYRTFFCKQKYLEAFIIGCEAHLKKIALGPLGVPGLHCVQVRKLEYIPI